MAEQTYKALGVLLTYPRQQLIDGLKSLGAAVDASKILPSEKKQALGELITYLRETELLALEEEYVGLFDRNPSLSLHLFEHIHGESRDRGQAMVNLHAMYKGKGIEIDGNELPDFLPLFLEYLSLLEPKEAARLLGEAVDILALIGRQLQERNSLYRCVFDALIALCDRTPSKEFLEKAIDRVNKENAARDIDEEWKEPEAFCGKPCDQKGGKV
jgi:nitrate reductase molybdenum cofactor assembly chaperone NarJ/NarW